MPDRYQLSSQFFFGDGVDGVQTITGGATSLSGPMRATTLTVDTTGTLNVQGAKVFATQKILIDNGLVDDKGNNGVTTTGGAATNSGNYFRPGEAGGDGVSGAGVGTVGTGTVVALGSSGGKGGDGDAQVGANPGVATLPIDNMWREVWQLIAGASWTASFANFQPMAGGAGGGGGSSNGGDSGGAGGGGGVIFLAAPEIELTAGGVIDVRGGNGADASGGSASGGGGGGGGGAIILVYHKLIDNSGGGLLYNGGDGGDGIQTDGDGGFGGAGGRLIQVDLTSGLVTVTVGSTGATGANG